MKNLLLSGLLVLIALVGWGGHTVLAQKRIDLTLKYNTTTSLYEVYGRPNFTDPTFGVGAGTQITIVLPASVADNALTVTSVNGGAWSDASRVYAPTADPTNDFHGIATAGNYTALVSGQETLFFTFGIAGACLPGVRLFNNTTDPPSSAAGFSGGDYKNYIGDALNFGDDVYQSNYTTPGGLCGTAPTIGFVSPADGTQTTTSPTISGTATPGASVTVGEGNTTLCTTTASSSGTWSCSNPTPFTAGPHTLTAIAGNLTGNSPVATTSFTAVDTPTIGITTPANNGTATTSPTVSGTATPNSTVTLTGPNNTTLCTTTASASGSYSCAVTVPVGANSVTAVACNAGGCSSPAVTNFTVVGPASLTVAQPQPGPTSQPVSGTATPGSTVTIKDPNNTTLCTTTASTSGTFTCTVTVSPGVTPVTVTACTSGGCASQTVSLTALTSPTVGITTPANGGTATTSPTVSGTATPNSTVTLTGPNNTTLCTTTASASGSYSCAVTVPVGANSVTAVACNAGGCSSPAVTNFTVVGPASLTVAQPQPGPTSQPVSGTATPGSTVTIKDPNNTTLCTTTASTSGTFTCTVTVSPGVTPVTVTACTSGGCASQTVSLTALTSPTVGITTPANGGTATTSPTVSGTATPNSTVTLTGPNNTTLCTTTASASGSYSCNISVPVGANSVTAVACNAGGCSTPAVTNFTVAGSMQLSVRAFLQGALINSTTVGRMRDDLRAKGLIPTTEPYSAMNYVHVGGGGGESITSPSVLSVTGANAIIDWVVVELRDANAPSTVVATRSALLQSDGDIVATDGVSPVTFGSISGPSYYVAVRHRNHLGVMTATAVSTSATSIPVVDFTSTSTPVYKYPVGNMLRSSAPMVTMNGVTALWAGNTSGDSRVIMQGENNDPDPIFTEIYNDPGNTSGFSNYVRNNVYSKGDVDMNGRVIYQGPNNEVDIIFFEVMSHPDNQTNQYVNYIISQQLP